MYPRYKKKHVNLINSDLFTFDAVFSNMIYSKLKFDSSPCIVIITTY